MDIKLTNQESEEYFFNALCNGLGEMSGYGLSLDYDTREFKAAKESLRERRASDYAFEDVLMEILKNGGHLILVDEENDGEYTSSISLKDVHELVCTTPLSHLTDMVEGQDDADTADVILQTVFYKKIIFG